MTLSFPFIFYGYIYDSNNNLVVGAAITATGDTSTSSFTDSNGKYSINLMDYASSGGTISVISNFEGERESTSFKLVISDPGKRLDITLNEALNREIIQNTFKYYNNDVYLFTNLDKEVYLKTSDYG